MTNSSVDPNDGASLDITRLRFSMMIGGILIALFMLAYHDALPEDLSGIYFNNRIFVQLPIGFVLLALTFHPRFIQFAQPAILLTILAIIYANYYFVYVAWERTAIGFPYEGTLFYAFFGFFVLGLRFGYALWLSVLSSLGFIGLMLMDPIYGARTVINVGLVVGGLIIGVVGRYTIDHLMGKFEDANEQLQKLSTLDPLTDLLNRRAFTSQAERLFNLQRRSGLSLVVFMFDLDCFKAFNDRYGHQAGDRAIRLHADIMRSVFKREVDILGRYGGEEFIAVTPSYESNKPEHQAADVLAEWREVAMRNEDSPIGGELSCSIGICEGFAADFDSVEEMIQAADEALYCAKNRGRGTFVVAEPGKGQDQWVNGENQSS